MSAVTGATVAETVANALGTKLAHYMGNTQIHAVKMAGQAIAPLVAERDDLLSLITQLRRDMYSPITDDASRASRMAAMDAIIARAGGK